MITIDKKQVEAELRKFVGDRVFVHCEATSYVFVRNFRLQITEAHIAGEGPGPFRVALRFDETGWLRIEGLTHYEKDAQGRLLLAGLDERGRMEAALHLGREVFSE